MPTCPGGHESRRADYCDICGKPLPAMTTPQRQAGRASASEELCPRCARKRSGQFCERCGFEYLSGTSASRSGVRMPAHPPTSRWFAVIKGDHSQYELIKSRSDRIVFPSCCPERHAPLSTPRTRIGRRRAADADPPEIDLSEPPEDPAVSHRHAELLARDDTTWDLVDCGSKNGTYVNGGADPIPPNTPVTVGHGTEIRLGAWTTIRLQIVQD
jgi:hypothetical protein